MHYVWVCNMQHYMYMLHLQFNLRISAQSKEKLQMLITSMIIMI